MSLHPQDWPQFVPIKFQAANEPGARASFPSKRFPSQRHGRQFVVVHWLAVVVPRLWNVVAECANGQKVDFILLIATPTSGGAAVWWLQTWSKGGGGGGGYFHWAEDFLLFDGHFTCLSFILISCHSFFFNLKKSSSFAYFTGRRRNSNGDACSGFRASGLQINRNEAAIGEEILTLAAAWQSTSRPWSGSVFHGLCLASVLRL